jgi:hypothetical protein
MRICCTKGSNCELNWVVLERWVEKEIPTEMLTLAGGVPPAALAGILSSVLRVVSDTERSVLTPTTPKYKGYSHKTNRMCKRRDHNRL